MGGFELLVEQTKTFEDFGFNTVNYLIMFFF